MNISVGEIAPPAPAGQSGWRTVVAQSAAELREHVAAWDALAADCLEPNPFYESWMLLPAVRAFGQDEPLLFILIYEDTPAAPPRLCAFFPFLRQRSSKSPFDHLVLWRHLHCFLCTPLLRAETAHACLKRLLEWARTDPRAAPLLRFELIIAEGPFQQHFGDFLRNEGVAMRIEESHSRAFWRPHGDAESYIRQAVSSRGRQDFRRQRKQLATMGSLEFRVLERDAAEEPWVRQFLELEAGGWKGQKGTALAQRPVERDYFLEITREAHQRGQLEMLGLFLDDRPIAMRCSFRAGGGSFIFKPAYAESFARQSPGSLLELEAIEFCHRPPPVLWVDSCTAPDSFLYNRLWTERRAMQTVCLSSGSLAGNLLVAVKSLAKALRHGLRRLKASVRGNKSSRD